MDCIVHGVLLFLDASSRRSKRKLQAEAPSASRGPPDQRLEPSIMMMALRHATLELQCKSCKVATSAISMRQCHSPVVKQAKKTLMKLFLVLAALGRGGAAAFSIAQKLLSYSPANAQISSQYATSNSSFAHSPPHYPSPWMDPQASGWEEAYVKAKAFVSQMTLLEKVNLTTGTG